MQPRCLVDVNLGGLLGMGFEKLFDEWLLLLPESLLLRPLLLDPVVEVEPVNEDAAFCCHVAGGRELLTSRELLLLGVQQVKEWLVGLGELARLLGRVKCHLVVIEGAERRTVVRDMIELGVRHLRLATLGRHLLGHLSRLSCTFRLMVEVKSHGRSGGSSGAGTGQFRDLGGVAWTSGRFKHDVAGIAGASAAVWTQRAIRRRLGSARRRSWNRIRLRPKLLVLECLGRPVFSSGLIIRPRVCNLLF